MSFAMGINGINVDAKGISSYHPDGATVAFGDGSVRFLSNNIDNETLRAMLTADNEKR